ncbi:transglutaminase domain-containing protein [Candidatus Woesearchaeota archaeon]|nr:transglutaminase domain-containing protein [Candidatus Woesearchaeota archaeon]
MIFRQLLLLLVVIFILSKPALSDNPSNLYLSDSLELQLTINGELTLLPETSSASAKEVSAELLLYPEESYRQKILDIDGQKGEISNNKIAYTWSNPELEKKGFGYSARIKTTDERAKVQFKVPFPLENTLGVEQYLPPTQNIDSDYPKIIAQATKLAEGENDAFKVVFKLASWVEENVKYDLNTLTAKSSQKASWVLENKIYFWNILHQL